jgi:hypothetical protein
MDINLSHCYKNWTICNFGHSISYLASIALLMVNEGDSYQRQSAITGQRVDNHRRGRLRIPSDMFLAKTVRMNRTYSYKYKHMYKVCINLPAQP